MTVTFFATGYLGNESRLIPLLLQELGKKDWKGKLYFQFVDLEYTAQKTNTIVNRTPSKEVQSAYIATAVVCEVVGGALIFSGARSPDKQKRRFCVTSGVILMAIGIIVGSQAFVKRTETQEGPAQIKGDIFEAIQGAQTTIQQNLVRGITIDTHYFPSDVDCQKKGKQTDLLVGYDIGNSLKYFRSLQENLLSNQGTAVVVGKDQEGPFMLGARGKEDTLRRLNWTTIGT